MKHRRYLCLSSSDDDERRRTSGLRESVVNKEGEIKNELEPEGRLAVGAFKLQFLWDGRVKS